ncbi:MAG: class I SAM-dependent methyltransferase [Verrucomicrobiota bacterium]|jgi:SAM-dependent methyltransferase
MNWALVRHFPWLDTRARFVAATPLSGALLDLGSSDGETLGHIAELRPDLRLFAADVAGQPQQYPAGCQFRKVDLEREKLPWPERSMDAITCMQLIEHLKDLTLLLAETARLIKPGGRIYFETPHPKTLALPSPRGAAAGTFTLNFFDDPTHVRPVVMGALAQQVRGAGLEVVASGISRNWLFAASWPLYFFAPPCRKKFTARVHWLGWSACLVARRPL